MNLNFKKVLLKIIIPVVMAGILFYYVAIYFLRPYYLIYHTLHSKVWNQKVEQFRKQPIANHEIVFIGNSLTAYFDLTVFDNNKIINRGIRKDFTKGVLERLPEIINRKPAKIFIEIGINDLLAGLPKETLLENYDKIVTQLITECPNAKIYIQSILPTCFEDGFFVNNKKINQKIVTANSKLTDLCNQYQINYIDLNQKLILNDQLNPKYTYDGVHLTKEGYQVWSDAICLYVNSDK